MYLEVKPLSITTQLPLSMLTRKAKPNMLIAMFLLVLTVWSGIAAAEHNVDLDPHHHEHHNCELFAVSKQIISYVSVAIEANFLCVESISFVKELTQSTTLITASARSPPTFIIL